MKYQSILETIGNTPCIKLRHIGKESGADLWVKLESFNPGGSVKDRTALGILRAAETAGDIEPGGRIVEDMIPAASDAIQGAWVNWLLYNVGRAVGIKGTRQRAIGSGQVDLVLSALLRMEKQRDRLTEIAMRYAS